MPRTVIVYRSKLLPISETFVRQQILSLRDWKPVLIGEQCIPGGLDLRGIDLRLPGGLANTPAEAFRHRLAQRLHRPYGPLVKALTASQGDLVHVHFSTDAVDIWPSVREAGLPMLVTLHGYDINIHREWWEAGHGGARRKKYPRHLLEMSQANDVHFIAVSEAIRRRAIEYGIAAEKIRVSYIGVDATRFRPGDVPIADRTRRVLFVGRLVEKKGTRYLVRAFAEVQSSVPDAELIIIGDGPLRNDLETLARTLNVRAQFLGAQDNDEVLSQMQRARIFCLPSITAGNGDAEGLPISILEAMAAGLPVVTSANGGREEAVRDGETGLCFGEADVDALGKCLLRLLCQDSLLETLASSARLSVLRNFTLSQGARQLESHYMRVVNAAHGAGN